MRTDSTVFIVGAGPIGMSLALLLDRLGIDSIVVERSPGITTHPKARDLNARTMELFRMWGLEEPIRA
ncbi:2-polyprenyl-6-methoxyphenol hydroxylase-like FAD-dependent oxidoreductase [Amycolatopsis bartoniae]|uniref:FAD-dependent monooxygenase n=1 Tax=Amycolatopsis bartoniae TaxID=941986 RepID=UPI00160573F7|nr:FAD-dependent monooxygenase [Amycolatopsis bartoniae]MBB2940172.1 2-polyprenyl-6-methoxyphenol hydroxylase-like FAD-dependent oxidoreductase [Amycolatopsis bartoniae]